jgi:hypothetical protein
MQNNIKKWTINKEGIKKSLRAVIEKKDITKLTKDAYNFTMNLSGFIAHYNHGGFMQEYQNTADLVRDLQNSSDITRPDYYTSDRHFSEGDQKEYYADKSEILNYIKELVENIEVKDSIEHIEISRAVASY